VRKLFLMLMVFGIIFLSSCGKKEKDPEPGMLLYKWAKAAERLDYKTYSICEAYPKGESVFREIFKDDYYSDISVITIGDPDTEKKQKDFSGNSFIQRTVTFEGNAVKRVNSKPYQIVNGDVMLIKFLEGERKKDGWLILNRTITRVNK